MSLFKIIFLFGVVISSSYSAGWDHNALVQMSWRTHWLEALQKMEGPHELTQEQRSKVLERFAQGRGRTTDLDLGADLDQAGHPDLGIQIPNNNIDPNYLNNELVWQWSSVDMRGVLESGIIPMKQEYLHHARDRRWTAGWILETMDIARQQLLTTHLFNVSPHNLANNDLLKARALSGTFGEWDSVRSEFVEHVSGMIQPGQRLAGGNTTVNVISCFHGIWNRQFNDLYFLPKGKRPNRANLFRVQSVRMAENVAPLAQRSVNELSRRWNVSTWGELFQKDDYAIIQVSNIAVERLEGEGRANSLNNILRDKDLLAEGNQVVKLQGENPELAEFEPNRIFAFGKPGADFLKNAGDNDGFCLVSDVSNGNAEIVNDPNLAHPLRRLEEPDHLYNYNPATHPIAPGITGLENKQAVSVPMSPGMSGGPVLHCQIETQRIKCKILGVAHGINLIQENEEVSFKGLIATRQNIDLAGRNERGCCAVQ